MKRCAYVKKYLFNINVEHKSDDPISSCLQTSSEWKRWNTTWDAPALQDSFQHLFAHGKHKYTHEHQGRDPI